MSPAEVKEIGMKTFFVAIIFFAALAGTRPANAYTTEATTTLTGMHWTMSSVSNPSLFVECPQMTDLYLDISGALNSSSFQFGAIGRVECNSPQGRLAVAVTGVLMNLVGGFYVTLYALDGRFVCTLTKTTLSAPVCSIYNIATGQEVSTFALTYAP